jgi:AraC family transcriptional regulator
MNQHVQLQTHNPLREHTLPQQPLTTVAAGGILSPAVAAAAQDCPMLEKLQQAIAKLLEAVDSALDGDRAGAADCISSVGALLQAANHAANADARCPRPVSESSGAAARPSGPIRGGLAPWQVRQVTTHIDMQLGSSITTDDLARIARLSPCHLRAQGLMLATDLALGRIAVECGLADQAHLCKLFLKIVGESPGMWRRARSSQPASRNNPPALRDNHEEQGAPGAMAAGRL